MSAAETTLIPCRTCGAPLSPAALVCDRCNSLVHKDRLEQLAAIATQQEQIDPRAAAGTWQQALGLLPPDARQYQIIQARIANLLAGGGEHGSDPAAAPMARRASHPLGYQPVETGGRGGDTWQSMLLKTGGSMVLSIGLFYLVGGLWFAVGIVLLIFVHEMGHVLANHHYGLRSSPPIFLGFLGAVIYLKDPPPNAKVEAIVGIAGPILGTLGALVVYLFYLQTGNRLAYELAHIAFWINFFNLIPVPPLDGGRVAAAITPKLWPVGIVLMLGWFTYRFTQNRVTDISIYFVVWLLLSAWPRVQYTLRSGITNSPYFKVEPAVKFAIASVYVGLAAGLYLLDVRTRF